MRYFDLHCDTLLRMKKEKRRFYDNNFEVDLNKAKYLDTYIQCAASFISDDIKSDGAMSYFKGIFKCLDDNLTAKSIDDIKNVHENGGVVIIPTVENGIVLEGDLNNISELEKMSIKILTITWNADNQIGSGILGSDKGITDFGKEVVKKLNERSIIIDISHSSVKLFWDVLDLSEKAVVASHSNSKKICSNKRNLDDEQIKALIKTNSLIGLNFNTYFLNDDDQKASIKDIVSHADHMLSLGAENVLAMGSDFDGAVMPKDILGIESIGEIYNEFLKCNYNESMIDKIFYLNSYNFFTKYY